MTHKDIILKKNSVIVSMAERLGFLVEESSKMGVFQAGEDVRALVERRGVKGIYDFEYIEPRDSLHYRRSGLNHVICVIMSKKNIFWVINIRAIIETSGRQRAVLIGRVRQNISLCRKYKVQMRAGSFAESSEHLRSLHDVEALLKVLGMRDVEVKNLWKW
ncbi:hypothetical protein HY483_01290 [Candidatus Woesearchaeota archaeon]|nr:hypothetical protein [Candidatus Woesearchaeota archaeon]